MSFVTTFSAPPAPEPESSFEAAPGAEKRVAPRAPLEVDVSLYSESQFFAGLTEDVSEGGLFIATYETRPLGSHLDLALTLPTGYTIRTLGVVRWLRELSESSPGMGIQFAALSPADLAAIRTFIKHRPPMLWDDGSL
jgi:uncharacterized protein (TIGR02266 family)